VPSPAWLDVSAGDTRVRRTGPATGVYEDVATGASIEARLLSDTEWIAALSPSWSVRVEAMSPVEWFVIAQRDSS
jgi:hypothetical protein